MRSVVTGEGRSVAVAFALVAVLASCADDAAVTTPTPLSSTIPTAVHTMAPTRVSVAAWEPVHQIPADLETDLAALLRFGGAWMLLPSAAPIEGPTWPKSSP